MQSEYIITLPVVGKSVAWKPLTLARRQDVTIANQNQPIPELNRALYMARIVSIDGNPFSGSRKEWQDWDDLDWDAFVEDVDAKETARRAVLLAKKQGGPTHETLKSLAADLQQHINAVAATFGRVMDVIAQLEAKRDPLDSPPNSTH